MIPIRDENPSRTVPYVVYILIALNVLFYLVDWIGTHKVPVQGMTANGQIVRGEYPVNGLWDYSMLPQQVVTGRPDLDARIVTRQGVIQIPHPAPIPTWLTIFTSMFMHGGLLHLGGNMLYLWIFGNNIEDVLGHVKFLLFYLIGGVCAAAAHIASAPGSLVPTVGASGAIAAVLGAYLVLYPRNRIDCLVFLGYFVTTMAVPALVVLGLWFVLQFFSATMGGMTPGGGGVAYWAHIGGFVAGAIGILLLGGPRLASGRRGNRSYLDSWYED